MSKRVELAGRALMMHYTINSLCEIEEKSGGSLDLLVEKQFTATRLLLWGALTHEQRELTLEDVGEIIGEHIIRGGTLEEIVILCADALTEAGFFTPAAQ